MREDRFACPLSSRRKSAAPPPLEKGGSVRDSAKQRSDGVIPLSGEMSRSDKRVAVLAKERWLGIYAESEGWARKMILYKTMIE